jgi:outer membrane receptor protein involved in Fe transport
MIKSGRITAALLASAALTLPTTAFGQDTEVSSGAVEDIVVTAQRREERLQDVPVSVTALSGDTLKSQRIVNASDLASVTPNLQSVSTVGSSTPIFALRGISMSDYSLNQASPVATYFDEVYKGNFALLGVSLFDLERVEVLRGPQGTLYGKNTTGGAVNLIAERPGFEPEASLSAGYGNFNRYEANGALQMPLNDTLAARLAFTYANANGYLRNLSAGQGDLGAVDVQTTNQRTEVVGVLQGLNLSDLRSESDGRLVASNNGVTLNCTRQVSIGTSIGVHPSFASSATWNQVRHIHCETVDHADLAVTQHARSVTHKLGLCQVRLHQDLTLCRSNDEPAVSFRHVGFVQHA